MVTAILVIEPSIAPLVGSVNSISKHSSLSGAMLLDMGISMIRLIYRK